MVLIAHLVTCCHKPFHCYNGMQVCYPKIATAVTLGPDEAKSVAGLFYILYFILYCRFYRFKIDHYITLYIALWSLVTMLGVKLAQFYFVFGQI